MVSKSDKTRSKITAAAITVFKEHGYEAASMDDVRVAAEVSKGLLYYHFSSKEQLLVATVEHITTAIVDDMTRHLEISQLSGTLLLQEFFNHQAPKKIDALPLVLAFVANSAPSALAVATRSLWQCYDRVFESIFLTFDNMDRVTAITKAMATTGILAEMSFNAHQQAELDVDIKLLIQLYENALHAMWGLEPGTITVVPPNFMQSIQAAKRNKTKT